MFSRPFSEIDYQELIHVMKELRIESADGVLSRRKLLTVIEYIMENGEITRNEVATSAGVLENRLATTERLEDAMISADQQNRF